MNDMNNNNFTYLFGILHSLKVNKGKTTGTTSALIVHHIDPSQGTIT